MEICEGHLYRPRPHGGLVSKFGEAVFARDVRHSWKQLRSGGCDAISQAMTGAVAKGAVLA